MPDTNYTFLTQVLSDPNLHIPVEANFAVGFTNLKGADGGSSILSNLNYAFASNTGDVTDLYLDVIDVAGRLNYWNSINKDDVFFANGVTMPGESINAGKAGGALAPSGNSTAAAAAAGVNGYGGFLGGNYLSGRTSVANVDIMFLETNQSFIDYVLRPWVIAVSHYGLFARNSSVTAASQNFKTDIIVSFINKITPNGGAAPHRKTITYKNAVPIAVDASTFNFSYGNPKTGTRSVKTTWTYSTYEVS